MTHSKTENDVIYQGYRVRRCDDKFYVHGLTANSIPEAMQIVDQLIKIRKLQRIETPNLSIWGQEN